MNPSNPIGMIEAITACTALMNAQADRIAKAQPLIRYVDIQVIRNGQPISVEVRLVDGKADYDGTLNDDVPDPSQSRYDYLHGQKPRDIALSGQFIELTQEECLEAERSVNV